MLLFVVCDRIDYSDYSIKLITRDFDKATECYHSLESGYIELHRLDQLSDSDVYVKGYTKGVNIDREGVKLIEPDIFMLK